MTVARIIVRYRDGAQGRGVRPTIARIATSHELGGFVRNDRGGVHVELEGPERAIEAALGEIHARLGLVERSRTTSVLRAERSFAIAQSEDQGARSLAAVTLDQRTCDECLRELDGDGRRAGYALISCASCGPRFSVLEALPYDRARTTMREFEPCEDCEREYRSLDDRRAHAQLIACPLCGPRYQLLDRDRALIASDHRAIEGAARAIARGEIVALQGVGGFQLLCDGANRAAVTRLRERKRRPHKPLALLVRDLEAAEALAVLSAQERATLCDGAGPIVLLRKRAGAVIDEVAPGLNRVGVMLPTTAAHAQIARAVDGPIVCTSGNAHGEPIAIDAREAFETLGAIADVFVVHDRRIAHRVDDSVVQVVAGSARVRRLGRGLGPRAFELGGPDRLCVGAHRDVAPVLVRGAVATQWPHVGAMDTRRSRAAFERAILAMRSLCGAEDSDLEIVCDAHPDYATTLIAERTSGDRPARRVLHHHAHIAAVLAEHGASSALGVAWDGSGLGADRSLAGGEFVRVGEDGARWIARFRPFSLPGGDSAARDGARSCVGALRAARIDDPWSRALCERHARWSDGPRTSSVGRLFDAVAFALGVCERSTFEGHAAMLLESVASDADVEPYPFALEKSQVDWRSTLRGVLRDRGRPELASARFHRTLVAVIEAMVERERAPVVALGGGCFNNARLVEACVQRLSARGVRVLAAERVASGDGAIALGQAWVSVDAERSRVRWELDGD